MQSKKMGKKRRHPYATLAVLTLAGASIVNIYNKAKSFAMEKMTAIKDMMGKG